MGNKWLEILTKYCNFTEEISGKGPPGRAGWRERDRQRRAGRNVAATESVVDLSKYRIREAFENLGEDREEEVMSVPGTILRWLADPWETATLGKLVLREIKEEHPALTVRDWRAWEDM